MAFRRGILEAFRLSFAFFLLSSPASDLELPILRGNSQGAVIDRQLFLWLVPEEGPYIMVPNNTFA